MKKLKLVIAAAIGIFLMAVGAQAATSLDFTEAQYDPGIDSQTHTVFNVLPGIDITFTALGEAGSDPYLSWNTSSNSSGGNDGYGVYNGGGYEYDEVEFPEMLHIAFSETVMANSFYLTDFFIESGAYGSLYRETGLYRIDGGSWNFFNASTFLGTVYSPWV